MSASQASLSMTGSISVASKSGNLAHAQLRHRAGQHDLSSSSAMSSCTNSTRNAEQRWPALPKAESTMSSTACSMSAELSTIMQFCPPVSAMSVAIGALRAARVRLMAHAVSVDPVKTTPAQRQNRSPAPAPLSSPLPHSSCNAPCGTPASCMRRYGTCRNPWRLLGGLGDDCIACHQRRRNLPSENRQGEIPRRDGDEHPARLKRERIALAAHGGKQRAAVPKTPRACAA